MAELSFIEKLAAIQSELKAPKDKENKFGKFKYRSCESILEAVKPHLKKHGLVLMLNDEIIEQGDRIYVKATARVEDAENNFRETTGYAREDETMAGMSGSQVTGAASSYARKYALNGLFAIDDTKDADSNEVANIANAAAKKANTPKEEPLPFPVEPAPAPAEPKKEVKCVFCGKPIKGGKVKGKAITAEEVMDMSMKIFGDLFCYPCMIKKSEEKQKATAGGEENA